jgi:hypothetical protein
VGRDLDELIPDMILQGRWYLFDTGNFKVAETNTHTELRHDTVDDHQTDVHIVGQGTRKKHSFPQERITNFSLPWLRAFFQIT